MSCRKRSNHGHHVLPQYAGGTDEDVIVIGDICHTMWHYASWTRTKDWRERGAYLLLKGQLQTPVSHSQKMKLLWSDDIWKTNMLASRPHPSIERMAEMGKIGGKANSKTSHKKAMANHRRERQVQLMLQNQPELGEFVGKWITLEHSSGIRYTTKLDYSLKPIADQMKRLVGKAPSSSRLSKIIRAGAKCSGWQLISHSF
jgi:hypothetical protein